MDTQSPDFSRQRIGRNRVFAPLARLQTGQLAPLSLLAPARQMRRIQPFTPQQRSDPSRAATTCLLQDPTLVPSRESPPHRFAGDFRIGSSVWLFTSIEVSSRLWISTVVGRRSYRNAFTLLNDAALRGKLFEPPLITTDGFEFHARVIRQIFGLACVYAQVIKSWRQDRVTNIDKTLIIGTAEQLKAALMRSEDSSNLNTVCIERLNLAIRQSVAYLRRRSLYHARCWQRLANHLQLAKCFYNFARPHLGLKFGGEVRAPAMQAGLASRRYRFREIFMAVARLSTQQVLIVYFMLRPRHDHPVRMAP